MQSLFCLLIGTALLAPFVSSLPECFRYRSEFIVTTADVGTVDVRLIVDTATLVGSVKLETCSDLRILQVSTSSWLDFWVESECNREDTRIWISPSFSASGINETFYLYHYCRTPDGGATDVPPLSYGSELTFSEQFVVMSETSCSAPFSEIPGSDGVFLMGSDVSTLSVETSGWFDSHGHTSATATTFMVEVDADYRAETFDCWASHPNHTHDLSPLTTTLVGSWEPPFYNLHFCQSPLFQLFSNAVLSLLGDFTPLEAHSSSFSQFSALDGYFPRGTSSNPHLTGGDTSHSHNINSGVTGPASSMDEFQQGGGGGSDAGGTHAHDVNSFSTTSSSNIPTSIDTVYATTTGSGPFPFDSYASMLIFTTGLPPKGYEVVMEYTRGVYFRGAPSQGASIVNASVHNHTKDNQITDQVTEATKQDVRSPGPFQGHRENHLHDFFYFVDPCPSADSLPRLEVLPVKLKSTYNQNGVYVEQLGVWLECNGVFWNDSDVCHGFNGSCIDVGNCSCWDLNRYVGTDCEIPVCDGLVQGSAGSCNDNGTCIAYDYCECDNGMRYTGQFCEIPVCAGIVQGSSGVCSDNGTCVAFDYCECDNDLRYTGQFCDIPFCDGIMQDSPGACNDNGTCIALDYCECENEMRYTGQFCEIPVCAGIPQGSPGVCSDNGTCVAYDYCECSNEAQYLGQFCGIPTCDGIVQGSPGACSDNGTCVAYDYCECDNVMRYTGPFCEIPVCGGLAQGPGACSDNGTCIAYDYCECSNEMRYTGQFCEIPVCDGVAHGSQGECSDNGTCIAYDYCECDNVMRYTGQFCEIPVCDGVVRGSQGECSENGTCVAFDYCECDNVMMYAGQFCQVPVCDGIAETSFGACNDNGTCVAFDYCECYNEQRYTGQFCDVPVCDGIPRGSSGACSDNGTCVAFDYCECENDQQYVGQFCQIPVCNGIAAGTGTECNLGNGTCVAYDYCECDNVEAYRGPLCDIPVCNGVPKGQAGECSGNGTCVDGSPPYCVCDRSHYGIDCELDITCDEIPWYEPFVCSGNGSCLDENDSCECSEGYGALFCNETICNGTLESDPSVCSSVGNCTLPDQCSCEAQWTGAWCEEEIMCYHYKFNDPQVCRSHGKCSDVDTCDCDVGYSGALCTSMFCFGVSNLAPEVCNHGTCWGTDLCMCQGGLYGRSCEEEISESVVTVTGKTTDSNLTIEIPYYVDEDSIPEDERELFNCTLRVLQDSADVVGFGSACEWVVPAGSETTSLLRISVTAEFGSSLFDAEMRAANRYALRLKLMTSDNPFERVQISLVLRLIAPTLVVDGGLATETLIGILAPLLLLLLGAIVVVVGLSIGVCLFRKKAKKLDQLDDFDILLKEQEHARDSSIAHLNIKSTVFEIDWEEIQLTKMIGKGGSDASIFLAKYQKSDVAIKIFKTSAFGSNDTFEEFEQEVSILGSLLHPYILKFFGASLHPPRVGIVMEYCNNGDLWEFLESERIKRDDKGTYPLVEKLRMFREVASALAYVHGRKIVHRDIKPQNVLITTSEETRLMDFGLSKVILSQQSLVHTQRVGTSFYMAPEVYLGQAYSEISYALMLYVCILETDDPYETDGGSVESQVAFDPAYRPRVDLEAFSLVPCLVDLIQLGWQAAPEHRPSASDFVETLTEHLEGETREIIVANDKQAEKEEELAFEIGEVTEERILGLLYENESLKQNVEYLRACLSQYYYYGQAPDEAAVSAVEESMVITQTVQDSEKKGEEEEEEGRGEGDEENCQSEAEVVED